MLKNAIKGTIVGINYALKSAIKRLIKWIGYDTHSKRMTRVTNALFFATFFNTGFMLALTNANFSEVSDLLAHDFHGTYYDYSPRWFATIGSTLVGTMFILGLFIPCYEAYYLITYYWLGQIKDSGWRCCQKKSDRRYHTKTSQIYQYLELHMGPEHKVDEKFAVILNVTFVTMTYGVGLPILFPIATLTLFILYATERYQVAYTC